MPMPPFIPPMPMPPFIPPPIPGRPIMPPPMNWACNANGASPTTKASNHALRMVRVSLTFSKSSAILAYSQAFWAN